MVGKKLVWCMKDDTWIGRLSSHAYDIFVDDTNLKLKEMCVLSSCTMLQF